MDLKSGHRATILPKEEIANQQRLFKGYTYDMIRLQPGSWLFPEHFTKWADKIYTFELKPSDTIIVTYPKCGTTWTQEIVWTMKNSPNLDNPKQDMPVMIRCPFIEMDMLLLSGNSPKPSNDDSFFKLFSEMCSGRKVEDGVNFQLAECCPHPRIIKTHLPLSLMPKDMMKVAKVIYVARNPKDCCVSYAHHSRLINVHGYEGTTDEFVDLFTQKGLVYGCYAEHFNEAWKYRDHPNIHFVFYEDLKANTLKELERLDKFIGAELTEEQLQKVMHHTSFAEMKKRNNLVGDSKDFFNTEVLQKEGGFFWKGVSGNWKETLTPEQEQKIDEWTKKTIDDPGVVERFTSSM